MERIKSQIAEKWDVRLLLLVFVIGGIAGFIYEEIFYRIDLGYFVKRGTTFGPWIPIYGFGGVFVLLMTEKLCRHPAVLFPVSMIVCGGLEFVTGYILHQIFHVRLWDYNVEIWNWGNIGGYICIRSLLVFGVFSVILRYGVCSLLERFLRKVTPRTALLAAAIPSGAFAADIVLSLVWRAILL